MIDFAFLAENLYSLDPAQKATRHLEDLRALTRWHMEHCEPYRNVVSALSAAERAPQRLAEVPYLPVQIFKQVKLSSVSTDEVIKVLTSSGTTGQVPSKIYLDRETSQLQTRALVTIMQSFIGAQRLPMILIESKSVLRDRVAMTARGAGILGFSTFGRDHFYLLDENYEVDWAGLDAFLERHHSAKILLFGFTFMVWKYFYLAAKAQGRHLDLGDSVLIHGGGWKTLKDQSVDAARFNQAMRERLGIRSVHNYYGMVEQVGSIFMECDQGHLHTPSYSDVLVRDPVTLGPLSSGDTGLLQVTSVLPRSYPGHSLLTEDLGTILGEDGCPCGRRGSFFAVHGRLEAAEVRGCSDTHAVNRGV